MTTSERLVWLVVLLALLVGFLDRAATEGQHPDVNTLTALVATAFVVVITAIVLHLRRGRP